MYGLRLSRTISNYRYSVIILSKTEIGAPCRKSIPQRVAGMLKLGLQETLLITPQVNSSVYHNKVWREII